MCVFLCGGREVCVMMLEGKSFCGHFFLWYVCFFAFLFLDFVSVRPRLSLFMFWLN